MNATVLAILAGAGVVVLGIVAWLRNQREVRDAADRRAAEQTARETAAATQAAEEQGRQEHLAQLLEATNAGDGRLRRVRMIGGYVALDSDPGKPYLEAAVEVTKDAAEKGNGLRWGSNCFSARVDPRVPEPPRAPQLTEALLRTALSAPNAGEVVVAPDGATIRMVPIARGPQGPQGDPGPCGPGSPPPPPPPPGPAPAAPATIDLGDLGV